MMLLSLAPIGEVNQIKVIWGGEEIKNCLKAFGLAVDIEVCVLSKAYDDLFVVMVKDKRIAIGEELARKIMV